MRHVADNAPAGRDQATNFGAREQSATDAGVSSGARTADSSLPQPAPVASDGGRRLFARWTEEEVAWLVRMVNSHGLKRVAAKLNRHEDTLRYQMKRRGYRIGWMRP